MITLIYKLLFSLASMVAALLVFDELYIQAVVLVSLVLGYLASNILLWLFIILVAATARKNPKGEKLSRFYGAFLNMALGQVCRLARIKVKVTGKEKLPKKPYLLVANHRSNFDNFILSSVIKNPFLIFISKPSNFKIPFAGRVISRCRYLAIDRENPRNALKTIHKAADMVKNNGASVGVFPEGTRGQGEGVAPFSEGCFLIAKKAACPVVVASIKGSDNIKKRFPRKTLVLLDFIEVIDAEQVSEMRSGDISEIAHKLISANI